MTESATADSAYYHTLNARPYFFPNDTPDKRLPDVTAHLCDLPAEIRWQIFTYAFRGNRCAVTARWGCYCCSTTTGPYRPDHKWLLRTPAGQIRREAQYAFIQTALWELHCEAAFKLFISNMTTLDSLRHVRHIRINVVEIDPKWDAGLSFHELPDLQSITFAPWQKGWTIDVPAREDSDQLLDTSIMLKLQHVFDTKTGYGFVNDYLNQPRSWKMFFVFPIRYLLPGKVWPYRWQLKIWRANLDSRAIDRSWREVHLVQEATLD